MRVGKTLYMMGGALSRTDVVGSVAATNRVESARILSYLEMPAVKLPRLVDRTAADGSWYYRVSAVNNAGPPRGWGEGLATREVLAQNESGQIEICWDPPEADDGSTPPRRTSTARGGRRSSGTAAATHGHHWHRGAGTSHCFTDDGQGQLTPAPGKLRGVFAAERQSGRGDLSIGCRPTSRCPARNLGELRRLGSPWRSRRRTSPTIGTASG